MGGRTEELLKICEPVFQHICQLNRRLERGGELDKFVARDELKQLLSRTESEIRGAGLEHLAPEIHRDLVCFCDCMMRTMPGELGRNWEMGPSETQRTISEELFEDRAFETSFIERARDALETYRQRPDDDARSRLAVYYVAIGLGCQGAYEGQLVQLEALAKQITAALGDLVRSPGTRLCRQAYEHTDSRAPIDAGVSIGRAVVLIVALVFLVVVLIGHLWMYRSRADEMSGAIDEIRRDIGPMADAEGG